MSPETFLSAFLGLYLLNLAVEAGLNVLNRREVLRHAAPPTALASVTGGFDADTFAKSRAYTLERIAFDQISLAWSAAVTLGLLLSGILPLLDFALGALLPRGPAQGAAFLAVVFILQSLFRLPFSAYATFRIEGKHGFNTMTWNLFWMDMLKGALLSAVIGLPLLYALLTVMEAAGPWWWLWAFLLVTGFQLALMVLYPVFIAPLFNRFKPLEDGALRADLLDLAGALRFPAQGIYVMDGSRRSRHSNAYFTGFGRLRRIVLFDTLLAQMDARELKSVLAHEIGHYKLGHIYRGLLIQSALLLALFWLASKAFVYPPLYQAFGFATHANPAVGLFLFLTVFSGLSLLLAPLQNLLSRRHEYQADAFAVRALGDAAGMREALLKLSQKNLSNLTPHPWYSAFHYSHPALVERLAALKVKSA